MRLRIHRPRISIFERFFDLFHCHLLNVVVEMSRGNLQNTIRIMVGDLERALAMAKVNRLVDLRALCPLESLCRFLKFEINILNLAVVAQELVIFYVLLFVHH